MIYPQDGLLAWIRLLLLKLAIVFNMETFKKSLFCNSWLVSPSYIPNLIVQRIQPFTPDMSNKVRFSRKTLLTGARSSS